MNTEILIKKIPLNLQSTERNEFQILSRFHWIQTVIGNEFQQFNSTSNF